MPLLRGHAPFRNPPPFSGHLKHRVRVNMIFILISKEVSAIAHSQEAARNLESALKGVNYVNWTHFQASWKWMSIRKNLIQIIGTPYTIIRLE